MKGSINTEIIERAGGRNVADDGGVTCGLAIWRCGIIPACQAGSGIWC